MNAHVKPAADPFAGLKVIDVDTHFSEPADLWTSRAPAAMKDRMPQQKVIDGQRIWVMDGKESLGSKGASSVILPDGSKVRDMSFDKRGVDEVHPGCSQVKARLEFMDKEGIWAQIVYPNLLGFGGQRAMKLDADLRLAATQIYNDALAEMQEESGQRLFGMALMPWWDVKLAVAELERCAGMGLRGVNTNSAPHTHGLPDLGDAYWSPFWEACVGHKIPVNFHIGASDESMSWFGTAAWPSLPAFGKLTVGGMMVCMEQVKLLGNLIFSGLLDRHPDLQFVSVESGIGWIPFVLKTFEYQLSQVDFPDEAKLRLTPTEYFRRNIAACFWFEDQNLETTIRLVGEDNVMFETDFPHPTCLYPDSLGYVRNALTGAEPELVRKALSLNAARIYNLPL